MSTEDYAQDWTEVVELGYWDYSWQTFRSHYSPSARRYFWDSQSGCSCYGWEDPGVGGWESGDRQALMRAVREYGCTPEDIRTVQFFEETA